jgi:hypothetical protein
MVRSERDGNGASGTPTNGRAPDRAQARLQGLLERLGDALARRQAAVFRLEVFAAQIGVAHAGAALAAELERHTVEVDGILAELQALVPPAEPPEPAGEVDRRARGA